MRRPRLRTGRPARAGAAGAPPPPIAATASRDRAGRDIVLQLLIKTANLALGVVTTIVLVRTLGDVGFGQWSTIFAMVALAGSFGLRGINNVTVERAAAEPERSQDWVGALVTLRVALSPPLTLTSLAISLALADTTTMRIAAVLVHTTLLTSSFAATRVVFQLNVRNSALSAIELAGHGVAWGAAILLVAALDGGLLEIAVAYAVVMNLTNLAIVALSLRAYPMRFRGVRRLWGPLLRAGLPVSLAVVLTLSYARIDQVLVFQLAGASDAGLYGAVHRIYDRLQFLPATLMTTLFPIIVAARAQGRERLERIFNTAIDYLLLVSLPALTITLAGPEPIARALFGAEFAAAAPALPVLMATFVLVSLGHLTGYLVITYGLQGRFVLIALVALAVNVAGNLLLLPRYGFLAAAWVILATELIVLGLTSTLVVRRMGIPPRGRRLGRIAAAACLAGALAWALRSAGAPLGAWLPASGGAYPCLLLLFGAVRVEEVTSLIRRT